ncbi:MAG: succinate dehydrogenase assembly factor 2 [Proteobacteria bacterium]|nr:succinate dehydrogenase assembly factor 2 [Pseudomonadota bacterium]
MPIAAAAELNRLRWRCRRGMRELDVLLERYLAQRWPSASAESHAAFLRLLELPDPELADYCLRRAPIADPSLAELIAEITELAELSARQAVYQPESGRPDPPERDS